MASVGATLRERLSKKTGVRIVVIGIGYVGLPLAVELAKAGFSVVGVDIDKDVIGQVEAGKSTIEGLPRERVKDVIDSGALRLLLVERNTPAKTDPKTLKTLVGADVFIVCVPTPLHQMKGWEPDTTWIDEAAKMIAKVSKMEAERGSLPAERMGGLESTTYPGTTRELFSSGIKFFKKRGKRCYLAYSPERTSPGPKSNAKSRGSRSKESGQERPTFQITRIVGGADAG